MKKTKVVSMKNLPVRVPTVATIAWWLFLDRLHVSPIAWGVFYTLAAIIWIITIVGLFVQEIADPFEPRSH